MYVYTVCILYVCIHCSCLQTHQKRVLDLIADGCEPPCGCWELNSGPLEDQDFVASFFIRALISSQRALPLTASLFSEPDSFTIMLKVSISQGVAHRYSSHSICLRFQYWSAKPCQNSFSTCCASLSGQNPGPTQRLGSF